MNLFNQVSLNSEEKDVLSEKFHIGKSSETKYNKFLGNAMRQLRSGRILLSEEYFFSYSTLGELGLLWIQTPACKNSMAGCCTVCNYWNGNRISGIIDRVIQKDIDFRGVTTLLVNTCGSCLDLYELCREEQEKLLRWLNSIPPKEIILETHLNTLTSDAICMVNELLPDKKIFFEVGIESISDEVLFYSLNKPTDVRHFREVLQIIHSNRASCIANVLLGAPFLSREEQIADAVSTIKFLLEANIDNIVLFPVNIKPNTIPEILYRQGMYEQIRADMLIKVLEQLPDSDLHKIDISWYGEHVENSVIAPYYCSTCQNTLKTTISDFNCSKSLEERKNKLLQMKEMICSCEYQENDYFQMTYFERLEEGYVSIRSLLWSGEDKHDQEEIN